MDPISARGHEGTKMRQRDYFDEIVQPLEGALLIFPSWLNHEVSINLSDEERISLAFNISYPRPMETENYDE